MSDNLVKIDHVVVLMMENRSFDHMLGYLRLEGGHTDVDGLTGGELNEYNGARYEVYHLDGTAFPVDPCHNSACVQEQLADGNSGFVRNFATLRPQDIGAIMGYYSAADVPVYDHLADEFCVCDQWFCSVPGPTWPNRLYSLSGNSNGQADNPQIVRRSKLSLSWKRVPGVPFLGIPWLRPSFKVRLPSYRMRTIFEYLDDADVKWRYYAHDIAFLRVFRRYRFETGPIDRIESFYERAQKGQLPAVSWIDPNFGDVGGRGNDDHPPADVSSGQRLVGQIYNALLGGGNNAWQKTLLVVTYDEHGGFYDHVSPGAVEDDRQGFRRYGVRVPAFVISPWVARGRPTHTVFDHTSILRTILLRFCRRGEGSAPSMGRRVDTARDLGELLIEKEPRTDCTPAPEVTPALEVPTFAPAFLGEPTDLQTMLGVLRDEVQAAGVPREKL